MIESVAGHPALAPALRDDSDNSKAPLYCYHNSLDEIPEQTRKQLQNTYFKKSFGAVWEETRKFFQEKEMWHEIVRAEANPKYKMALVFRWYFGYSTQLALAGKQEEHVNYQVQTGPALGAFNQWVKGTPLETAEYLNRSLERLLQFGEA